MSLTSIVSTTPGESAQGYLTDPRNEQVLVYVNGEFFRRSEACVSVFDSGFVLGDGIWEGLRLVEGKLISLQAHLVFGEYAAQFDDLGRFFGHCQW